MTIAAPILLTVKDAATRLNVAATTIYDLVQKGRLPHFRIGVDRGAIRIDQSDLDAYLNASRATPNISSIPQRKKRGAPVGFQHLAIPSRFGGSSV